MRSATLGIDEPQEEATVQVTEEHRDGASVRFPPPFVPLIALGVGALLDWLFGALATPLLGAARLVVGGGLVLAGLGLILAAGNLFRHSGQDPKPWKSTPEIIATGIYRWTRNPMYLGMGLAQAGIGVLLANLWIVALVPVTWLIIYGIAIRHEEAYLATKFGEPYRAYTASVRRWI